MASLGTLFSNISNIITRRIGISASLQVRHESTKQLSDNYKGMIWDKWPDYKMKRDVKRRKLVKEWAPERLRLVAMKRNNILPPEIRELASKEFDHIPRQSALRQIVFRCKLTSRPRGVVYRWGLSRIVFRDLADHNTIGGVQRARW